MNALCDSLNERIVCWISPGIEVIAVKPHDVGKTLVTSADILSISICCLQAVITQRLQPSDRLHWIQEDGLMVISRDLHDAIEAREIRLVRFAEVVVLIVCSSRKKS